MTYRAQLPNPPAVFVGRDRELSWLADALERGSVVLITAPQGLGKTALVRKALHESLLVKASRVVVVDAGHLQTTLEVRMEILRVMAAASPRSKMDLRHLQADPEQATIQALGLAERRGSWLVIDAFDPEDIDEGRELLTLLASYAKRSHWVITSRLAFQIPLLAGQTLRLETMNPNDIRQTALAWAPGLGSRELAAALAVAAGSPFQLSQALASGGADAGVRWLTRGVSKEGIDWLRCLSILETQLPLNVLSQIVPDPGEGVREDLERRGLLIRGALGWSVHSVVRGAMAGVETHRSELMRHAATILVETQLPEATIEAARLWLEVGDLDQLADLLDQRAQQLFSLGYAPSLWRLFRSISGQQFQSWKLTCAAELGNPTALSEVHDVFDGRGEQFAWAETLAARGANDQALAQLAPLLGASDRLLAARAKLLTVHLQRRLGRFDEAIGLLNSLEPSLARDAEGLACRVGSGQLDGAKHELARLLQEFGSDIDEVDDALLIVVAETALLIGARAEAERCLRRLARTPRGVEDALLTTRRAQLIQARLDLEGLEIDAAQERVDRLRRFARGPSVLRPWLDVIELACRLTRGELEGWERRAEAVVAKVDVACDTELAALKMRYAAIMGLPPTGEPIEGGHSPGLGGARVDAWLSLYLARHQIEGVRHVDPLTPELGVLGRLLTGTRQIVAGTCSEATETLRDAEQEARRHGLTLHVLETMSLRCDGAVGLGELRAWHQAIEALKNDPLLRSSPRLANDVELHRALAGDRCPQASLEVLAQQKHSAPVAARRARALLGGSVFLDAVDNRVVKAIVAFGYCVPTLVLEGQANPWEAGWGLDERHTIVWLPGRAVDLSSKRLLWQILMALVKAGGGLDKERLVYAVWDTREYHPLRHDGRMHTAVRKLRAEIEDDPKNPGRFVTTDDGYKLIGPVRFNAVGVLS